MGKSTGKQKITKNFHLLIKFNIFFYKWAPPKVWKPLLSYKTFRYFHVCETPPPQMLSFSHEKLIILLHVALQKIPFNIPASQRKFSGSAYDDKFTFLILNL